MLSKRFLVLAPNRRVRNRSFCCYHFGVINRFAPNKVFMKLFLYLRSVQKGVQHIALPNVFLKKKLAILGLFFFIFRLFCKQLTANKCSIKVADD